MEGALNNGKGYYRIAFRKDHREGTVIRVRNGMTEAESWKGLSRSRKAARIAGYAIMIVGVIFMAALSRTWSWYALPIGIAILIFAALFAVSIDNWLKKKEQ